MEKEIFNIDGQVNPELWYYRTQLAQEIADKQRTLKEFDKKIKDAIRGEAEINIGGKKVATIVYGQFSEKKFCEEQPGIAGDYTKIISREVLDVEKLKSDHPNLYREYLAKRLVADRNWKYQQ